MKIRSSTVSDLAPRRIALTGFVFGAVALLGVDVAFSMKNAGKHHRSTAAAVRMVSPADSAVLGGVPTVTSTALALALLLWLGRRSADRIPQSLPAFCLSIRRDAMTISPSRARQSISYHTGGLYGP